MDPAPGSTLTPSRPVLSLADAVTATGKSRNTLRRMLRAGEIEGAAQLPEGNWAIPVEGLLAAGLHLHPSGRGDEPGPGQGSERGHGPGPDEELTRLRNELVEMRVELAAARTAADERAKALDDLRRALETNGLALRMLTPSTSGVAPVDGPAPAPRSDPAETPRRPRWWRRTP